MAELSWEVEDPKFAACTLCGTTGRVLGVVRHRGRAFASLHTVSQMEDVKIFGMARQSTSLPVVGYFGRYRRVPSIQRRERLESPVSFHCGAGSTVVLPSCGTARLVQARNSGRNPGPHALPASRPPRTTAGERRPSATAKL